MPSFDIVSKLNMQEVDNAVNSVNRELTNRYDFKGADFSIIIDQKQNIITIIAPDEYKLGQIRDSLKVHATKRAIDVKAFLFEKEEKASGNSLRQIVKLKNGIEQEIAKEIIKDIKDQKIKVQSSIRGDEVRIEGKNRDDLQFVIQFVKGKGYNAALQFINFRE